MEAAEFTNINVQLVQQPVWTAYEVDVFRGINVTREKTRMGRGQARCWLGHLNVLHEMLVSKWATALIVEDDADWDIAIKHQLAVVAPMIRNITNATDSARGQESPYGNAWDLLWLGHCGDLPPLPRSRVLSAIDETLPESPLYRKVYGDHIYHPPHLRMVYSSRSPICTYAYAVTAEAALKIYQRAAGRRERIITIDLRNWCRDGTLRCVTVYPELFHHHKKAGEPSSEIAVVEGWEDLAATAPVGYTANIRYSARCNSGSETLTACQTNEGDLH